MVKTAILSFFLLLGVAFGCDDDGGRRTFPTPTPAPSLTPVPTLTPTPTPGRPEPTPTPFPGFECPTDEIAQTDFPFGYGCGFFREEGQPGLPDLDGTFIPQGRIFQNGAIFEPCEFIDCFTMECSTSIEDLGFRLVIYSEIFLEGDFRFEAVADVEGEGLFNFVGCNVLVP